ncbi:MAG TPA: hypothetical protein VKU00_25340 [Chthonomonadaceae bacterium]|nr:hypothetical protein [Chthonomonadaceae bacterium]
MSSRPTSGASTVAEQESDRLSDAPAKLQECRVDCHSQMRIHSLLLFLCRVALMEVLHEGVLRSM